MMLTIVEIARVREIAKKTIKVKIKIKTTKTKINVYITKKVSIIELLGRETNRTTKQKNLFNLIEKRKYKMSNALATLAKQTVKAQTNANKKPAVKAVVKKTANKAPTFKFGIITGRPVSGTNLFAYTAAWLEMSGLNKGKSENRRTLENIAGATAISYHIKNGRMIEKDGKVSLSEGGKIHFAARKDSIDTEAKDGWIKILKTGKADNKLIKNQACLRQL